MNAPIAIQKFRWAGKHGKDDILLYPNKDIICVDVEPPTPNGDFHREELILSFSPDTLQRIYAALNDAGI